MDEFRSVARRNHCPPCQCGGKTKKIIAPYVAISDLEPYYDWNLGSHIQGKQHRKQVMREQGVEERVGKGWK